MAHSVRGRGRSKGHLDGQRVAILALVGIGITLAGGARGLEIEPAGRPSADTIPLDGRGGGVIAYSRQPGPSSGVHEIIALNADGTGGRKLIDADIGLNHQAWSPDGRHMSAVGYVNESTWSIYGFRLDGTGLTRLTHEEGVWDTEPVWSPDGTRIAFTRMYPSQHGRSELWLMNADGSDQHSIGVEGFGAHWSPDGTRFVYASRRDGTWEIYVCGVGGDEDSRLTSTVADEMSPTWSPTGMEIAFTSNADGDSEVMVMAADGTGARQLTHNASDELYPAWSPDGTLIAFQSDLPGRGQWEVYVMNANGSDPRSVTQTDPPRTAAAPTWRPS